MTGVATAIGAAAVVGAGAAVYSANKSSGAIQGAANSSISEQQREFNLAQQEQAPFRNTGVSALNQIAQLYGLDTTDANGNIIKGSGKANFSGFTNSPDFQFSLGQGQDAINRSAAARGGLLSGAAVKAGETFATGLADQNFQQYVNNLSGVAGVGQAATNATQAAGTNAANQISGAYNNAGNARASAYGSVGQTIGNSVNGLAGNYLLYKYLNPGNLALPPNSGITQTPGGGFQSQSSDGYITTYG